MMLSTLLGDFFTKRGEGYFPFACLFSFIFSRHGLRVKISLSRIITLSENLVDRVDKEVTPNY